MGLGAVTLAAGGCGDLRSGRCPSPGASGGAARPNVVVFLTDDLGYGDLGCYGHPFIRTPNLDNFAAEGMRLTDCYSAAPICSPARAGLLTGRCSYRTGVYHLAGNDVHLRAQERTIAELLHEAGYATCFLGKWHLGSFDGRHPLPGDQGFDHWFATEVNSFSGPQNPKNFVRNGKPVGQTEGWYCDVVVDEAIDWLKNGRPDKPFFVEICTHEPHTPLDPPEEYRRMYDAPEVQTLEKKLSYGRVPRYPEDNTPQEKRYYYGTVTQLDSSFGRLMDALDGMGLAENTLVIFTSDNGPEYPGGSRGLDPLRRLCAGTPGNLRGMKRHLYEGLSAGQTESRAAASVPNQSAAWTCCPRCVTWRGHNFLQTVSLTASVLRQFLRARASNERGPSAGTSTSPAFPIWPCEWAMRFCSDSPKSPPPASKTTKMARFELYNLKTDVSQKVDLASQRPEHLHSLIDQMNQLWRELQREGPTWPSAGGIKPAVGRFPRD
jgi:arylsulfatase A